MASMAYIDDDLSGGARRLSLRRALLNNSDPVSVLRARAMARSATSSSITSRLLDFSPPAPAVSSDLTSPQQISQAASRQLAFTDSPVHVTQRFAPPVFAEEFSQLQEAVPSPEHQYS